MDIKKEDISEVGFTKANNRAKKKSFETYGHDAQAKSPEAVKRAQTALGKAKNDKSGAVKRATFRANRALEALIIEGWKEVQKGREDRKSKVTNTPSGREHAAFNMAGHLRREGNKSGAKLFLKASKGERKAKSTLESLIISTVVAMSEGRDDLKGIASFLGNSDPESITKSGGDPGTYAKIKASKDAKLAQAVRNTGSRKDTLGKMGGFRDKQGNPWKGKVDKSKSPVRQGAVKKPLPLNLKGKASPGKKVSGVRGKAVNTSRSTGEEGNKADAHAGVFNKLVQGLSKSKK